jgi:hypothetical protein
VNGGGCDYVLVSEWFLVEYFPGEGMMVEENFTVE